MAKKKEEIDGINLNKIKDELNDYIDVQVRKTFNNELDKSYKRLIREKNKKIAFKNFIIILLVVLIVFLTYLLYSVNYFDKFFTSDKTYSSKTKTVEREVKEKSLDELKKQYSYLIDNIYINENSSYLNDYYDGNLTTEIKNYITINSMNIDNLTVEDDCNIIDDKEFEESYKKLFNDKYVAKSFNYNDNQIRYISKMKTYITDKKITKDETNIKREITGIEEKGSKVVITTIEGLVKEDKLYNILSGEEISDMVDDLSSYSDKLNKLIYVFSNGKLEEIRK